MKFANHHSLAIIVIFTLMAHSCSKSKNQPNDQPKAVSAQLIRIIEPTNGKLYSQGEKISLQVKVLSDSISLDSLFLFVNAANYGKIISNQITVETEMLKLGTHQLRATAWYKGTRHTASVGVVIKSAIKPQQYTYRVVNTYPHDKEAYTQGLFYYNGYLVESTGQHGQSSLRKVELNTGRVIKSSNLERQYFGEGCALIDGKIYQLTWTTRKGFIYDAESFGLISTFDYPTQGWGLTTMGSKLVMSDGSNILYILEPQNFAEIRRIEVYDNAGPVMQLNELEYIDGKIWANVYQTDRIVIIDPETGTVEAELNLSGILPNADRHANVDVLNGIAWDSGTRRLFVTGKNWPKLFEIRVK